MNYPIRGVTDHGQVVWYTGKAGAEFISADPAQAFRGYGLDGAITAARRLNLMSEVHGVRFMVPVNEEVA